MRMKNLEFKAKLKWKIFKMVDKEKLKRINEMIKQEKSWLEENKEAYIEDIKNLKEELRKDASDWNCDVINNMSRCAQKRKVNIDLSLAEVEHLESVKNSIKNGINVFLY